MAIPVRGNTAIRLSMLRWQRGERLCLWRTPSPSLFLMLTLLLPRQIFSYCFPRNWRRQTPHLSYAWVRAKSSLPKTLIVTVNDSQTVVLKSPYQESLVQFYREVGGFWYNKENFSRSIAVRSGGVVKKVQAIIDFCKAYLKWRVVDDEWTAFLESSHHLLKDTTPAENSSFIESQAIKTDFTYRTSDLHLKFDLFPYQHAGVRFIDHTGGRAIIGDEMGLGKTAQAIAWVVWKKKKALVICPKSSKIGWAREIQKFTDASVQILDTNPIQLLHSQFTIIHFEICGKLDLSQLEYDTLIVDESHKIKNFKSQRTKNVIELGTRSKHILLLSGTAILNRPVELFTQIKLVAPKLFPNFSDFAERYCASKDDEFASSSHGASNLEELNRKIQPFYIRRLKKDVIPDMPPKLRQILEFPNIDCRVSGRFNDPLSYLTASKIELAKAKVPFTIELIDDIIENGDKVIVFSDYVRPCALLKDHFGPDPLVYYSSTLSLEERADLVDKFQNDENKKIFVSTIKMAGVGLTLTAASKVIFNDLPWTPADLRQCEDRAHRVGQRSTVNIYQVIGKDTLDTDLLELLHEKMEILDKVLDGGEALSQEEEVASNRAVVSDLVARYRARGIIPKHDNPFEIS